MAVSMATSKPPGTSMSSAATPSMPLSPLFHHESDSAVISLVVVFHLFDGLLSGVELAHLYIDVAQFFSILFFLFCKFEEFLPVFLLRLFKIRKVLPDPSAFLLLGSYLFFPGLSVF